MRSSRAGAEVVCDEFFAHFGWACSHIVQTVVAHIKELLSWKPPIVQYYQKRHRGASIANRRRRPFAFASQGSFLPHRFVLSFPKISSGLDSRRDVESSHHHMIGGWSVPMWVSWIGLVVAGGLAFFGLRLAERDAR